MEDLSEDLTKAGRDATRELERVERPELAKYLAGWREFEGREWKTTSLLYTIEDARHAYDAGRSEIVHCRTLSGWALLSIPRKLRARRKPSQTFGGILELLGAR